MMVLLKKYITAHPECLSDESIKAIIAAINSSTSNNKNKINLPKLSSKLTTALDKLNSAYGKLDSNVQTLPGKMQKASKGAGALSGALGKVSKGSSSLSSGMKKAAVGANMLSEKSKLILAGDKKAYTGVTNLNKAIKRIRSSVDKTVSKLKDTKDTLLR